MQVKKHKSFGLFLLLKNNSSHKNLIFISFISFFTQNIILGQSSAIPLGSDAYHYIDRLDIKTGESAPFVTGMKPYLREDVIRYVKHLDTIRVTLNGADRKDIYWLYKENNEWLEATEAPKTVLGKKTEGMSHAQTSFESSQYIERKPILKYFYNSPANFWEVNRRFFHMRLNPIVNFRLGKDKFDEQLQFLNQRGIELRGGIDDRIYFYANIEEQQARFAPYVVERTTRDRTLMGANLYKNYKFRSLKDAYDWTIAQGYLGFNVSRHVGMQFGHGRNFLGDGYRSLWLSDNSTPHLFFKINSKFWKFNYQNIFAQFSNSNSEVTDSTLRRYFAGHVLTFRPIKNFDFSLYEGIMIKPRQGDQFDLNYLNPVIFYRSVEYISGSQDNALVGAMMKYNFLHRFSLYGQFMLDEFNLTQLFALGDTPKGWWANKYAYQAGLKYIDMFGVNHLDGRIEMNKIRPYTYMHYQQTSYTNLRQPLAHPLGANLKEVSAHIRYQPTPKIALNARVIRIKTGEDSTISRPYGQNLLSEYYKQPREYGNVTGQGIAAKTLIGGLDVSYQFMHNMYAELQYFYRRKDSAIDTRDQKSSYFGAGLRINIAQRRMDW